MRDKILVIDDEPNLRKILEATLSREGYDVASFGGFEEAKVSLNTEDYAAVITDLQMPGASGMEVLQYLKQYSPDLPVILITAFGTIERAVAAMRAGAFDFVLKPFHNEELFRILSKAVQSRIRRKREPAPELMSALGVGPVPLPLFGRSPDAERFRSDVERITRLDIPLLMTGETGTGKRSVAREIHRKSVRVRGPFIQLNLEAVPPVFQITELFGAEKGSTPLDLFSKPGVLELAQGGTLLLEEIDALSIEAQNRLFTAFENEWFSRNGGIKRFPLDFRILATTREDPELLFRENRFHVELFQKISVETLHFKPLRDRKEDLETDFIPYLASRASAKLGFPPALPGGEVVEWLVAQDWTGNLGELEARIQRAVSRSGGAALELRHFIGD